ncbi:hypothetical protein GCM10010353_54920 [Streptomyces chryseus]|uniref:hypothetical protein n=2 Tax=Streptomyces chryseus TaxID=68186 RepID=UPI00110FCA7B|nr:hypothetical protein [Streptomyces chryseus]GGX32905.1 hypothetical protein GCM10010353_54920 [Streptomyces chryseus]
MIVCGGIGTGTAFGVASMERTDVPGLTTRSDGRWDYPALSLPALPAGSPRPSNDGNRGEIHHADPRELLLPLPAGATQDKELDGGWVTPERFAEVYEKDKRREVRLALADYAVRHVAARGWTMPDGTSSRVYLLRFNSVGIAERFKDHVLVVGADSGVPLAGSPTLELDPDWASSGLVENTMAYLFAEEKPYDGEQTRLGYVQAGDTVALLTHSRKGGAPGVPFHQSVILQNQLLG